MVIEVHNAQCYNLNHTEGIQKKGKGMKDKRIQSLLKILQSDEYFTAEKIGNRLNISEKTARNLLKTAGDELLGCGARIEAKSGLGYRLVVDDADLWNKNQERYKSGSDFQGIPDTSEERVEYLIRYLLETSEYVKMDELSEKLFISKKTLAADMKNAEKILQGHHITLKRKPYYGIKAEGNEFDIRLCMARYGRKDFFPELPEKECWEKRVLNSISECVAKCLKEYNMSLSDVAFQHLIIHLYIAMRRVQEGCYIPIDPEHRKVLKERKEYSVAEKIVDRIDQQFQMKFPDSEIGYISIHLAGKVTYNGEDENGNLVINQEILDLAEQMLKIVYETFRYDFRDDLELKMSICQHLVPLG